MSRGEDDDRGDARCDLRDHGVVRPDDARDPDQRSSDLPDGRFSLPSGLDRHSISGRDRSYHLRDSESHTLETLATFQIAFDRDLREGRYRGDDDRLDDDLRSLIRQGLAESRTITADHHGHTMRVLALSDDGRDLLQDHRRSAGFLSRGSEVRVHSGFGNLSALAVSTGGSLRLVSSIDEVRSALQEIAGEMRYQYVIWYDRALGENPGYHRLRVEMRDRELGARGRIAYLQK